MLEGERTYFLIFIGKKKHRKVRYQLLKVSKCYFYSVCLLKDVLKTN